MPQIPNKRLPHLKQAKNKKKFKNASDEEFDKAMKVLMVEHAPMLRRLAKK